jgi:hypothetical protein
VLHGKNEMKVVVVFNDHPRTHLGCWNCHVFNSLLKTIAVNFDEACLVPAGTVFADDRPCLYQACGSDFKFYLK